MSRKKKVEPVVRTSAGLRDALFDELDAMREGRTNPRNANAIAKLSDVIISTVRMEVDVNRHLTATGQDSDTLKSLGEPILLGN